MAVKFDVVAQGDKYVDAQGQEKYKNIKIGVIIQKQNGDYVLKCEQLPVGWNGWANLYPPKPRQEQQAPRQQPSPKQQAPNDFDDDIPF